MNRAFVATLIVFCCWISLFINPLAAQTEPESASGALVLQSQKGKSEVVIRSGITIEVKYTTDPRTFHGKQFEAVLDSAIVLSAEKIELKYLERIVVRNGALFRAGKKLLIISLILIGSFYFLVGLALLTAGTTIFVSVILGLLIIVLALPTIIAPFAAIVGLILMLAAKSSYNLLRDWKATTQLDIPIKTPEKVQ